VASTNVPHGLPVAWGGAAVELSVELYQGPQWQALGRSIPGGKIAWGQLSFESSYLSALVANHAPKTGIVRGALKKLSIH
jgi:hypothetical protein